MIVNFLYGIPSGETTFVLGITTNERGRECIDHPTGCGHSLHVGDIVRFKYIKIGVEEDGEFVLEVRRVVDGKEMCRVGFLGKHLLKRHGHYHDRYARVTEKFSAESTSTQKRRMVHRNKGCAVAELFSSVYTQDEGKEPTKRQDDECDTHRSDNAEGKSDNGEGKPIKKQKINT